MNRRDFLRAGAGAAALIAASRRAYANWGMQSPALTKFKDPLRGLGQMAPAAKAGGYPAGSFGGVSYPAVDYYRIAMRQFNDYLHSEFQATGRATAIWGYGNAADATSSFRHLGGAIIARKDTAVRMQFTNDLPATHILPVDVTSPGPEPGAAAFQNRAVVHLHGGHVPWVSDGGPFHWFTPGYAQTGASVPVGGWLPDTNGVKTYDFWYPNHQSARLMWYHDHAVGNTRLNAYAGLATAYVLQDAAEDALVASGAFPSTQIPLVFQDKVFDANGRLWYPDTYNTLFFGAPMPPPGGNTILPYPSVNPEVWGDTVLVNGTVSPYVDVEPRRYRFRILNACNTRFMRLRLVYAVGKAWPDNTEPSLKLAGPPMQLVGTEGGFLDPAVAPQGVLHTVAMPLVLAPAERADVIIDFSKVKAGQYLILYNDSPVPFPGGTPLADFYPTNNKLPSPPMPGFTPDTRAVLQFRIKPLTGAADPAPPAGWTLPPPDPAPLVPFGSMAPPAGTTVRVLTLNEAVDNYGRLSQLIGINVLQAYGGFGMEYLDEATETPNAGAVEVWQVFNLTADAHPLHFHLANCQILSRQPFNVKQFNGIPSWTANPRPPDPDETGWKETVKMYPGECTTVLMKFDLPPDPVIPIMNSNGQATGIQEVTVPESPRTGGYEYVWHCHILEHEEHDMMRPLVVNPPASS